MLLDAGTDHPEAAITEHVAQLEIWGGADLCLLGIGRNGHVAFNEPPCNATACARTLTLSPTTRQALASNDRHTPNSWHDFGNQGNFSRATRSS